jgi:hypothetical protein
MSQHDAAPQAGQAKKKCGGKAKLLLAVLVLAGAGYGAMKVTGWRPGLPQSSGAAPGVVVPTEVLDRAFVPTLKQLRRDIAKYRRDHRNKSPDFQRDGWLQMTSKTDESGVPGPAGGFGPYFTGVPGNPLNGFSNVEVVDGMPVKGTKFQLIGWVVDRQSGQVWGTTSEMEVDPR